MLNKVTDDEVVLLRMRFFKDWSRWSHLSVVQLSTTGEKALHEHGNLQNYQCSPMFTNVHQCSPMFTNVLRINKPEAHQPPPTVVGQQQSELDLPRPQMDNRHRDALLPRPASHIKVLVVLYDSKVIFFYF